MITKRQHKSHSSRGNCALSSKSTLPDERHPSWVGPDKRHHIWEGPDISYSTWVGRTGVASSDVTARTETAETAKMWHKSIRPEDCVQDIPPSFAGI